ncbi:hypothetical protein [Marinoscillum sp. MHG1-6]|uniref:hypothetical protein n=1 Tax=Marinoscillum sp. MHG1-6 TaxID=2959627 RepID=UPI00215824CF|nr:hypothetical protein [Marinoscillum sp. MHG1-6]
MFSLFYPFFLLSLLSCQPAGEQLQTDTNPYEEQLKAYWYNGEAELTSYQLQQARYGEIRDGHAVHIFVTEDFSSKTFTKADQPAPENVSVLKLNSTRKFVTGIYPYSMMTSTFFPFPNGENSLKISTSSQEWCGHTYMELLDQQGFQIANHSYFQSESKKSINLDKALLEDDLWSMIRINPDALPIGKMQLIPSFTYIRLSHQDLKSYQADISIVKDEDSHTLSINYPNLERTLMITFEKQFPFQITEWTETYYSGWGENRKQLTTTGTLMKTIRTDYWTKNHVADSVWREKLGLD